MADGEPRKGQGAGLMHTLSHAVFDFAWAMLDKLWYKYNQGYRGWEDLTDHDLDERLKHHIEKRDWIDVANFCLFAWLIQKKKIPD